MRGCAGIAALNALRHPRARVSLQSRTRASKPKDQKQKKSNREKSKPARIQRKKNQKQENQKHKRKKPRFARRTVRLRSGQAAEAAVPTWGILELPDPCHKRPQPLAAASRQRQSLWGREVTILERKTPERRKRKYLLRKTNSESGRGLGRVRRSARKGLTAEDTGAHKKLHFMWNLSKQFL